MTSTEPTEPWAQLQELVARDDTRELDAFLMELSASDVARAVSRLSREDQARLVTALHPDDAAGLVEQLPGTQAAVLVEQLEPADAARIVQVLPSDERADLMSDLPQREAEAILAEMPPQEARELRALVEYPNDVAGGLMVTELLAYPTTATVAHVIRDLRVRAADYSDDKLQYVYVTAPDGTLVGVLRLRDLLFRPEGRSIEAVMIRTPLSVRDTADLAELAALFDRTSLLGVPVIDAHGRLLGVVHRSAVQIARTDRSDRDYLLAQGIVGGEELRGMPMLHRARRRLGWLSVNILLNLFAASVIAVYQDTLHAAIALAVFLPIISDMSGCSGNQAVAVSMRELTLGLLQPRDALHVWLKEIGVGVVNGVVLGVLIAAIAWLWKGNAMLGLVVGTALTLNTAVAVSVGGTIPLALRKLGMDPALASGPILTTVTDMCGFFLTLAFASAVLPSLTN